MWGTHSLSDMCFPGWGTLCTRGMWFLGWGTHIIYKVVSLCYLRLLPLLAAVFILEFLCKSLLFSLRVYVFIHAKENWPCFLCLFSRHFRYSFIMCRNVSRVGYDCSNVSWFEYFRFKSRPCDQESTNCIRCLVEWNSRNITISNVFTSLNVVLSKSMRQRKKISWV